jgi:hypothetical protein
MMLGSGTGVSPVCRLHDSHGRDARFLAFVSFRENDMKTA